MSQGKIWYVVIDGKADGPHSESEIKDDLKSGKLSYADLVFKPGLSRWVHVSECQEFERRDSREDRYDDQKEGTATSFQLPKDDVSDRDWVILVRQTGTDGKNHYVQSGPFNAEQIKKKIQKGDVKYDDHAWRKGLKVWTIINSISEFERRVTPQPEKVMPKPAPSEKTAIEPNPDAATVVAKRSEEEQKTVIQSSSKKKSEKVIPKAAEKPVQEIAEKVPEKTKAIEIFFDDNDEEEMEAKPAPKPVQKHVEKVAPEKPKRPLPESVKEAATVVAPLSAMPPHPNEVDEDDEDEVHEPKPTRTLNRKKALIAGVGATLGMALTYAAMNAYNESLEKNDAKPRKVASVRMPVQPAPEAIKIAEQAQPNSGKVEAAAVNPELENRPPRKPSVLKIVSLKMSTERPQMVLESDLPGGTEISVHLSAKSGAILKYPSFDLDKKIAVTEGQLPSIDFREDNLAPGDYNVTIRGGGLTSSSLFSVGEHDSEFQKRLAAFRAQVALQRKKEKTGLDDGLKFVGRSYASLTKEFRKARATSSNDAKKKWTIMLRSWRKDFERENSVLKHVDEKNRNYFVYPEALLKLKNVEQQLFDVVQLYDKSLKTGRSIASQDDMEQTFEDNLKELKDVVRKAK